ncbi:MAG: hypothetical protein AAFV95_25215 [Bacteroidota bacterium]
MTKKIDWLNHGLEFAVVFIGILIAFQLNKCAENSSREELLSNHMTYLEEECQENLRRLEQGVVHSTNQVAKADTLLQLILARGDVNQINRLAVSLLNLQDVDLQEEAFNVLTQSGDIRFLKDFGKKKAIISLYEAYHPVAHIDGSTKNLYDRHFYPYIKKHFDLVSWGGSIHADSSQEHYYSAELGNTISTYRYLLDAKVRSYRRCQEKVKEYLAQKN